MFNSRPKDTLAAATIPAPPTAPPPANFIAAERLQRMLELQEKMLSELSRIRAALETPAEGQSFAGVAFDALNQLVASGAVDLNQLVASGAVDIDALTADIYADDVTVDLDKGQIHLSGRIPDTAPEPEPEFFETNNLRVPWDVVDTFELNVADHIVGDGKIGPAEHIQLFRARVARGEPTAVWVDAALTKFKIELCSDHRANGKGRRCSAPYTLFSIAKNSGEANFTEFLRTVKRVTGTNAQLTGRELTMVSKLTEPAQ